MNITNFTYADSQMPFFDLLGTLGEPKMTVEASENNMVSPGEVSIRIANSSFERIELSDKLRFFTT
jgi:hypothetical protein